MLPGKGFDDPEQFVRALRRSEPTWCDGTEYCNWYFRGQRNAEWDLLPSGFRQRPMPLLLKSWLAQADKWVAKHGIGWEDWLDTLARPDDLTSEEWGDRLIKAGRFALAQCLLGREFALLADYSKHPVQVPRELYFIGDAHTKVHRQLLAKYIDGKLLEYGSDFLQVLALAQHHGVPTVLLDWTYNPLAAVFFAAEDAWKNQEGSATRFAVLGVHRTVAEADTHLSRITLAPDRVPFLDAQEGLFVWYPAYFAKYLETGSFPCFDTLLAETAEQVKGSRWESLLVKYTLPVDCAAEVLQILWREKVSPAHLRPALDSVTDAMTMRTTWLGADLSPEPDAGFIGPEQ